MILEQDPINHDSLIVKILKVKELKLNKATMLEEDESIGMRLGKGKATEAHPKKAAAERDESYGDWGKRSKDWKKA